MAEINKIKFKRGLDTNRTSITPADGEPIWVNDEKRFYIGDGSTSGGVLISDRPLTVSDTAPTDPDVGDRWLDTSTGTLYVWYVYTTYGQWIGM